MEKLLKDWRQDAVNKHQYESAIYIGDKLLALTRDPKDAFWLAQVHFSMGNYTRAQSFLERHNLVEHSPACRYLAAHCNVKQFKHEEALSILGEKNPTQLIAAHSSKTRRKLQHSSAATSALQNGSRGKHHHTKGLARPDRIEKSEERDREDLADIRFEAAMCHLRGVCYSRQGAFDRAKECFQDAVRIDVQCFEAFDALMKNCLLGPDEEWQFLESLDFDSIPAPTSDEKAEAAAFVRMLYTTRLSKYKNASEFATAHDTLSTFYKLSQNHDLLIAKADLLFVQCRFAAASNITQQILDSDPHYFAAYPIHLACLHELGATNALFLFSHRLADTHPEEPTTWLAVGTYYLATKRVAEARRYFSKASTMDPTFGPAWIGFAHTFAADGEHDQAISAYSTAARLFQGTHLPALYLGMQHLQLNNTGLALEYLHASRRLCTTDPLLLNELGVAYYHSDTLDAATVCFQMALDLADQAGAEPRAWLATRANLGHALRRRGEFEAALEQFDEVLRLGGKDAGGGVATGGGIGGGAAGDGRAGIQTAKGLVLLEMRRSWEAVCAFHAALAVQPQDPVATDLLARALEEMAAGGTAGIKRAVAVGLRRSVMGTDAAGAAQGSGGEGGAASGARVRGQGQSEGGLGSQGLSAARPRRTPAELVAAQHAAVSALLHTSVAEEDDKSPEFGPLGGLYPSGRRDRGFGSELDHEEVDAIVRRELDEMAKAVERNRAKKGKKIVRSDERQRRAEREREIVGGGDAGGGGADGARRATAGGEVGDSLMEMSEDEM